MPKFVKLPVVIDAIQWFPGMEVEGVVKRFNPNKVRIMYPEGGKPARVTDGWVSGVETLEGFMEVNPGDWIITGVEGERYPCKDSVFQASYKKVEDE